MATFGAVKTAIARRLLDENHTAITDAEIGEAVNEAIVKYKSKRFWFNTTDDDLTIAAGDTSLTLPTDFLTEIPRNGVTITFSGFVYQIKKTHPTIFDAHASNLTTGRPVIYVHRDGVLEIYPTADRAYDGKLYYLKEYTALVTDGSTNDFLEEATQLIQNEALANLHGELRQDEKMEDRYTKRADTEYNVLRNRTALFLRSGNLTVEQ